LRLCIADPRQHGHRAEHRGRAQEAAAVDLALGEPLGGEGEAVARVGCLPGFVELGIEVLLVQCLQKVHRCLSCTWPFLSRRHQSAQHPAAQPIRRDLADIHVDEI
jgi:hypothetical protein